MTRARTRLELMVRPDDTVDLVRGDAVTTLTVAGLDGPRRELAYDLDGWPGVLAAGRTEVVRAGDTAAAVTLKKVNAARARLLITAPREVRVVRTPARWRGLVPERRPA